MNYEQKYKEALERAVKIHSKERVTGIELVTCEDIFPELKESEDERIRKGLIKGLSAMRDIHKHQTFSDDAINIDDAITWLKKQGEQNPIDKIEPKFKIGDWVVNKDGKVNQVVAIDDDCDWFTLDDDTYFSGSWKDIYHLWTIQDAKDGDILMANAPFIFNGNLEGGIGCPGAHCGINTSGKFQVPKYQEHWTGHTTTPATKEQCDMLFQKMKEAGYEWNAEKKELRKIKQSCYHNDGLYYAIDILEKTFGKVEGYQSDDGKMEHQTAIETVNALYHKKPAWSEEDEQNLQFWLDNNKSIDSDKRNWLKSLKERVQPKQGWGEEDEKMKSLIISTLTSMGTLNLERYHHMNLDEVKNWLKSLNPNHWKPSEQNIKDLEWCADLVKDKMGVGFHRLQVFIDEIKKL